MLIIASPSVLLLTTDPQEEGKKGDFDNDMLHTALSSRGAKVSYQCWRDESLTPASLAAHTHITFLTTALYNLHFAAFTTFLDTILVPATKLNPMLVVFNPAPIVSWNSNKTYLSELQAANFHVPATDFVDAANDASKLRDALMQRPADSPIVVKPSVSASGVGTKLLRTPHQLSPAEVAFLEEVVAQPSGSMIMLQEFLPNIAAGEYSLVFVAGRCLGAALKVPKQGEFLCNAEFGGRVRMLADDEVPEDALRVGKELWRWIGERFEGQGECMYARVDGVMSNDRRFVLMELELIEPDLGFQFGERGERGLEAICNMVFGN